MIGVDIARMGASLSCWGVVGAESSIEAIEGKGSHAPMWVVCSMVKLMVRTADFW
jgi:hypothetical protein